MEISAEDAMRNAEASLRMEGMTPSPEVLRECKKVLDGEITHEQYIVNLRERYMVKEHGAIQP